MSQTNRILTQAQLAGATSTPWWRESAIIASQNSNAINIFNISSSSFSRWVAPFSGKILGISVAGDAAISAGTMDLEAFVANAEVAQITINSGTTIPSYLTFATPVPFSAGQAVDFRYSSDAALAGLAIIQIIPVFVFES